MVHNFLICGSGSQAEIKLEERTTIVLKTIVHRGKCSKSSLGDSKLVVGV